MLNKYLEEIKFAIDNGTIIADKMDETGQKLVQRTIEARLWGTKIQVIRKLDRNGNPVTQVFCPRTGCITRGVDPKSPTPKADVVMDLLLTIFPNDHMKVVEARRDEYNEAVIAEKTTAWRETLTNAEWAPKYIDVFLEYLAGSIKDCQTRELNWAILFVQVLDMFSSQLRMDRLPNDKHQRQYDFGDVLYNLVINLYTHAIRTKDGERIIPHGILETAFANETEDKTVKNPYIRESRKLLRKIYEQCHGRTSALYFIVVGLIKYFEAKTGDTVQVRMALEHNRRQRENDRNSSKLTDGYLGTIGDVFSGMDNK